jgi:hypothetical protein
MLSASYDIPEAMSSSFCVLGKAFGIFLHLAALIQGTVPGITLRQKDPHFKITAKGT